jgi:hypothetical protein
MIPGSVQFRRYSSVLSNQFHYRLSVNSRDTIHKGLIVQIVEIYMKDVKIVPTTQLFSLLGQGIKSNSLCVFEPQEEGRCFSFSSKY